MAKRSSGYHELCRRKIENFPEDFSNVICDKIITIFLHTPLFDNNSCVKGVIIV